MILLLAILGMIDSLWLTYLQVVKGGLSSTCQVSSTIHCGVLALTQYSEWFGVPVAVFSFFFYLLAALLALRGHIRYLFLLSIVAVGMTIWKIFDSITIGAFCPFCAVLYFISILFWFFALRAVRRMGQPVAQQ